METTQISHSWVAVLGISLVSLMNLATPNVRVWAAELEQTLEIIEVAESTETTETMEQEPNIAIPMTLIELPTDPSALTESINYSLMDSLLPEELITGQAAADEVPTDETVAEEAVVEETIVEEVTEEALATECESTETSYLVEDPDLIWIGWTFYESSTKAWNVAGGDGGYAFGRYQFDARSSLSPFLEYCISEGEADYSAFNGFISTKSSNEVRNLENLPATWKKVYAQSGAEFSTLQTEFAMDFYYLPVKQALLEMYNINLDDYSAVLKGTVWSIAVRDGRFVNRERKNNCLRSVTDSYTEILAADGAVDEEKWLNRIYVLEAKRHPGQSSRWNHKQRQAALDLLATLREMDSNMIAERTTSEIIQLSNHVDLAGRPEILFEMLALPDTTSVEADSNVIEEF